MYQLLLLWALAVPSAAEELPPGTSLLPDRHWRPAAAYFRRDWSLTPAGQAWIDLVHDKWWTRESGLTDADGRWTVRGFLGHYEVTAALRDRSASANCTLSADERQVTLRLAEAHRE